MNEPKENSMKGINSYSQELTREEMDKKLHRGFVGGMWEELGLLQFEFLRSRGLTPQHKLLDIGCGCLRGGIHFIKYLEIGNYYGMDINDSLIQAGKVEIQEAGLANKLPNLLVDDQFRIERFGTSFDFMVSVSVFTHLPMNSIIRCLCEVKKFLNKDGIYFSTFFQAPASIWMKPLQHHPGGIITNYDFDPFHYSVEEMTWIANLSGLNFKLTGEWGHPRDQKMAAFINCTEPGSSVQEKQL
ncbi:MAG: class I SAM-dependent methyltransferase [Bacteroidales bacterium]|nr:class I SAM-dependent methyltransferase [Bacteroidales bacterium]